MRVKSSYKGLVVPSLIWLSALGAAALAGFLRGLSLEMLLPLALVGSLPALLSLLLTPILRKEWAQILVLFAWLALAIVGCIAFGFIPMAILFLCAPAAAALFEKEKVVEALIMAAIIAAVIYFAGRMGHLPETSLTKTQILWGQQAGFMATLGLIIATLLGAALVPVSKQKSSKLNQCMDSDLLMNAIDDAILRVDDNDQMVGANDAALKIFGIGNGTGQVPLTSIIKNDAEAQSALEHLVLSARKSGVLERLRLETRLGGDEQSYMDLRASRIDDEVIVHVQDVTSQEERLDALRRTLSAETSQTDDKSLFFAGVSHELRTPLNAIIGFSDMMRSRLFGPLPGKYAEYADLIHDSGQHMLDLIGDVLDMSKVEAGKYELNYNMFDASDVVRSTVKMIRPTADAAKVRMDIDIQDDEALLIDADRKAVRQILLNLISNAIKFSHKGGSIRIEAKAAGDTLNLTVQDYGVGMNEDELAVLGTPYKQMSSAQTVDERGTGLGVSLVKSLTELHGGRFAAASQKAEGTTIDVFLPLNRPK